MSKKRGLFQRKGFRASKKTGVVIAIATHHSKIRPELGHLFSDAGMLSADQSHPFWYQPYHVMDCEPLEAARNKCVAFMMEKTEAEWLYLIDDDEAPEGNWWTVMQQDADIVSALTIMQRNGAPPLERFVPNSYQMNEAGKAVLMIRPPAEPYTVDLVGMACAAVHRRVFDKLGLAPFKAIQGEAAEILSEGDLQFCRKARAAGFKILVDPRVKFDHWKVTSQFAVWESILAGYQAGYQAGLRANRTGDTPQEGRQDHEDIRQAAS